MSTIISNSDIESMLFVDAEVQSWLHDDVEVYSAGKMVTYYVDTDTVYEEKVKKGQSCLSPTTFTPTKSGWTFAGWREDKTASGSVLSSKIMGNSPITLYAVFKQTVTVTYNGNGSTGGSTAASTGSKYYNNGNTANATIVLASNGFTKTNYAFTKWAMGSAGGTQYSAGASVALSANTTFYAVWTLVVNVGNYISVNNGGANLIYGTSTIVTCPLTNVSQSGAAFKVSSNKITAQKACTVSVYGASNKMNNHYGSGANVYMYININGTQKKIWDTYVDTDGQTKDGTLTGISLNAGDVLYYQVESSNETQVYAFSGKITVTRV